MINNHLKLSSKAKTLEDLAALVKLSKVLPIYRFYAKDFKINNEHIIESIIDKFKSPLIIRSSSSNEDNLLTSHAGGFDSVLNVDVSSKVDLIAAIDTVISSYGDSITHGDEVFVQPMLLDVSMSGVIFTSDIDTLSGYYIVNYDESGSTCSVTSGSDGELKTFICLKNEALEPNHELENIINASKECEDIFGNNSLDIEFAVSNGQLYILQVRAIVTSGKENLSDINLIRVLRKLEKKICKLNSLHPNLLGNKAIFGVMPDWNPAEIIGIRPKKLALSLYKELITDETWAYQRDNYGYRNLRSHPLLVSFVGVPYIDVRVSFNSFIPKELDSNIASKLVNYYLNMLELDINRHDKVEFEIVFSCFYFGIEKQLLDLQQYDFSIEDITNIKTSLLDITNKIICSSTGLYKNDLKKIEILKERFNDIVHSDLARIDKIYWLIKDTKRYGTLPFAGVARAAFIAVQFLNSFVKEGIFTSKEHNEYLSSLSTVSKNLSKDLLSLSKAEFLDMYGHLRPGTYDILSPSYDEDYATYFSSSYSEYLNNAPSIFTLTDEQRKKVSHLLIKSGLNVTADSLMDFIKESIEGREYAKFVFTKSLSQVLKLISNMGDEFSIPRQEMAHLDIQKILNLYSTLDDKDVCDVFREDIKGNIDFYQYTKAVKLPSVIIKSSDVFNFYLDNNEANFVTLNKVKAGVIREQDISNSNLAGSIVCIKSADPGYDFLFSKNISGLVTCYGGANSHMAIRCAELGLPAVIGCGEIKFKEYSSRNVLEIDAENKQVRGFD